MGSSTIDDLPLSFRRHLSEEDVKKNSTLQSFDNLERQITILVDNRDSIDTILDIGCGRGSFVAALGDYLQVERVYGIDVDGEMREFASSKGVETFDVNVENQPLPMNDESIDLVLSFGLLEHLRYYDGLFEEVKRVSRDGWFWVATPNLASWVNRFALLAGYQPRNVEVSQQRAVGTLPIYKKHKTINHVHAPTYSALLELFRTYNFEPVDVVSLTPYQHSRLVTLLDSLFSLRTSWSRRIAVLSRQV